MSTLNLLTLLLCFQSPGQPASQPGNGAAQQPPTIWEEIALLESAIRKTVKENQTQFSIANNDPVNGYYIPRVGVMLMIPVRYRPTMRPPRKNVEHKQLNTPNGAVLIDRKQVNERLKTLQEQRKKNELLKEANFEQVVTNMKNMVPEVIGALKSLPQNESVILVVEERAPAWYFTEYSRGGIRKVVTLTVDKDLISTIHADQTVMKPEWLQRIKRTTATRKMVTSALSGTDSVE